MTDEINDLINRGIKRQNDAKNKDYIKQRFSPTDVDKCPRQLWYEMRNTDRAEYNANDLKNFFIGNMVHEKLQEALKETGKQLVSEYYMLEPDWHGLSVSGYVDSIILTPKGLAVIDFKTTKQESITYLGSAPKPEHAKQLMMYLDLLKLRFGYLVYWNKNNGDVLTHEVKYDKGVIKEIVEQFRFVNEHLISGVVPEANRNLVSNWRCRYCKFIKRCTNEGKSDC